jgi:glycosyltransferase involved in cell wall biosynthesis
MAGFMNKVLQRSVIIIPAFNEEEAIGPLLNELRETLPGVKVVVIDDCSRDTTAQAAEDHHAVVIRLPSNLGVGGAVQAGFQYAWAHGYHFAIRCDGDGQHPPTEIPKIVEAMVEQEVDLVTGARIPENGAVTNSFARSLGIRYLSVFLSYICKKRVTDPTSGFQMFNRPLIYYFANRYPMDYPEPESLALIRRQGYQFCEVPVRFQARTAGASSIDAWAAIYYAFKVTLALVVDRARSVDQRYARHNLLHLL